MEFKVSYKYILSKYWVLLVSIFGLILNYHNNHNSFTTLDKWFYVILPFAYLFLIYTDYRKWRKFLFGRPILTVNEEFIHDLRNDVKYFWKDINYVMVNQLWPQILEIKVYDPAAYLERIGNRKYKKKTKKEFERGKEPFVFSVDIDCVNVKAADLEKTLMSYSDSPVDRQKASAGI